MYGNRPVARGAGEKSTGASPKNIGTSFRFHAEQTGVGCRTNFQTPLSLSGIPPDALSRGWGESLTGNQPFVADYLHAGENPEGRQMVEKGDGIQDNEHTIGRSPGVAVRCLLFLHGVVCFVSARSDGTLRHFLPNIDPNPFLNFLQSEAGRRAISSSRARACWRRSSQSSSSSNTACRYSFPISIISSALSS